MQLTPRYTSEQLIEAVANSNNIRQVCLALGLRGRGANYDTIRRHIAQLDMDTSHFARSRRSGSPIQRRLFDEQPLVGRTQFPATREELEVAVASSSSLAEVARRLDLVGTCGNYYRPLHALIERYQLDISHFRGQGWSRGQKLPNRAKRPLAEILVENSTYQSARLRIRLTEEGLKEERCEGCLKTKWNGFPIPLELDHINGDRHDNRIENLRLLCPNCHALTDNYRGRNIGR